MVMRSSKLIATHSVSGIISLLTFALVFTASTMSAQAASSLSIDDQLRAVERLIYGKKYEAAIDRLEDTIKQEKGNADAWNLLGYALRKSGDMESASEAYTKALTLNKNHKGALEYQGELFISQGKMDDARNNLKRLSELCPSGCEEQEELAAAIAAAS